MDQKKRRNKMLNISDEQIQKGFDKINKREEDLTSKLTNRNFNHHKSFDTLDKIRNLYKFLPIEKYKQLKRLL